MLQSEFFERTKVNLTGEEYVKIETLYNEVQMDKDEFCKEWLKLRNNPLLKETIEAFYKSQQMVYEISKLKGEIKAMEAAHSIEKEEINDKWMDIMGDFAKTIVRANEDGDARVYDVIEEQYGIAFIIKTKYEANIPLSDEEIKYMVSKL